MAKPRPYPATADLRRRFDVRDDGIIYWREGAPTAARYRGQPVGATVTAKGYVRIFFDGRPLFAHRVVWKWHYGTDPVTIDHINGDRADNRIENLRSCTSGENARNMRPRGGASRFKGVTREYGKWRAMIKVDRKFKRLGVFDTEEAAALAYDSAARDIYGDFALTNLEAGLY